MKPASLWNLLLYYTSHGITKETLVELSKRKPDFPIKFSLAILKRFLSGDLRRSRNTFRQLSEVPRDLRGYLTFREEGVLLLGLDHLKTVSLEEAIYRFFSTEEFKKRGFFALSYCQIPPSLREKYISLQHPKPVSWEGIARDLEEKLSPRDRELSENLRGLVNYLSWVKPGLGVYVITSTISSLELVLRSMDLARGESLTGGILGGVTCPLMARVVAEIGKLIDLRGIIFLLRRGVCGDMRTFDEAERGHKKGIAVVSDETLAILKRVYELQGESMRGYKGEFNSPDLAEGGKVLELFKGTSES